MPKFLVEATYTAEGHKGLAKDKASGRKTAITQAVKKLGGKLDAMYFCLGENDVILIADMPDHVSAAALGSAACASGMARTKSLGSGGSINELRGDWKGSRWTH
jgi:uncharacterized protein with GYD domain